MGATYRRGWPNHYSSEAADGVDAALRPTDDGRPAGRDGRPPRSRGGRVDVPSAPAATQNSGSQVDITFSPHRPP